MELDDEWDVVEMSLLQPSRAIPVPRCFLGLKTDSTSPSTAEQAMTWLQRAVYNMPPSLQRISLRDVIRRVQHAMQVRERMSCVSAANDVTCGCFGATVLC